MKRTATHTRFEGKGSKAAAAQFREAADADPAVSLTEAWTEHGNVKVVRVWK